MYGENEFSNFLLILSKILQANASSQNSLVLFAYYARVPLWLHRDEKKKGKIISLRLSVNTYEIFLKISSKDHKLTSSKCNRNAVYNDISGL